MATKKTAATQAETAPKTATKKATAAKSTTKVTFSLPKEAVTVAKTVAVVGEFNNWDIQNGVELKKQKDGSFKTTLELEAGKEYQYRFIINGEVWANAWDAPKYVPTEFGVENSVVIA